MSDSMREVVETLDPVSRRILPPNIDLGTLVPLKTTLELRDNLSLGQAYITRAPQRYTNDVVKYVLPCYPLAIPSMMTCRRMFAIN